jgi:hypothetical protein
MKIFIRFLIFLSFVTTGSLFAQVYYPVVARVSQTAPYSAYLIDYSNPAQTSLTIQIQQNDREIASRAIKLKIFIEGQGFTIESTDLVQGEPTLVLNYGQIYNLSTAEVANYFKQYNLKINPTQYARPFAEGTLRFGVQVVDVQTNRPLSGVQWSTPIWISLNEPPVWIMPVNDSEITPSPVQNIVFQWVPRHTNVNDVEYEFTLKELVFNAYSVGNIQNIFLSQPTFYSTRTTSTSLVYNSLMPPLVEGRVYAYRVRAIARRGLEEIGLFKNFGYSEVQALFYGEPMRLMKSPVITRLNRNEITNDVLLDWKAESNHTSFSVAHREKNKNLNWVVETVPSITGLLGYSHNFTNLDPEKNYEIRVGAIDKYNQSAYSSSVFLDSIPVIQSQEVELTGKVLWAFSEDEEDINDKSTLTTNGPTQPSRSIVSLSSSQKPGKNKRPLESATLAIVSSELDNLNLNHNSTDYELLKVIHPDKNGNFSYQTDNFKFRKDLKNIYLIVSSSLPGFNKIIKKIGRYGSLKSDIHLGELVLTSSSLRYSPKIISSKTLDLEEVGLYRIQSVLTKNPLLPFEANSELKQNVIQYNEQNFVKIADFTSSATVPGLLGNAQFNDYYVLRIKEKNKRAVVLPIAEMPKPDENNILHISDFIAYQSLPYKIEGTVSKGGFPLEQATVQAFGTSVLTDEKGFYSLHLPETVEPGIAFDIKAIDPLTSQNSKTITLTFSEADLRVDFVLNNRAFYLEAQLLDEKKRPVNETLVILGSNILKTDSNGWFSFSNDISKLPSTVQIRRDGYNNLNIPISQFTQNKLTEGQEQSEFINLTQSTWLTDKSEFFEKSFTEIGLTCTEIYTSNPIELQRKYPYRIITFREKTSGFLNIVSLTDSAEYVSANLAINEEIISIPKGKAFLRGGLLTGTGGHVGETSQPQLKVKVINTAGSPLYVDEEFIFDFPETASITDTTTFLIQLKEGVPFKGVVIDSTIYIAGLHVPGTVKRAGEKLNSLAGVSIEVSGGSKTLSDEEGKFTLIVPVRRDLVFNFTKEGYLKTSTVLDENLSNNYKNSPKNFYMVQKDTNSVPTIKTLMGFDVQIDKLQVHSSDLTKDNTAEDIFTKGNRTYQISGKIIISPEGDNSFKVDKALGLKFNNLVVRMESPDSENAVLVYKDARLTETSVKTKLFGYAPVTFSAGADHPYLRLVPMRGDEENGQGMIVASSLKFTQTLMAGMQFGSLKLENPDEEIEEGMRVVFASLPLQSLSEDTEYKIVFPSKVSDNALKKEGIDETTGPYYKAEFSKTNISGVYSGFNLFVNHETATLTQDGINLDGHFSFPKIWKFKSEGALEIQSLEINTDFNLEKVQFGKNSNSKKTEITKFSIANRWVLYVNSLIVGGNFREFGFGGEIVTDKENKLIINSLSLLESDGQYYPSVELSTDKKGLTFKSINFTTLPDKVISFKRDVDSGDYEISAALKMDYSGSSSKALGRILKKIFPLNLQIFEWSTGGKFAVGIAAQKSVEVGPIGVSMRRLLYTKGTTLSRGDINEFLTKTDEEAEALKESGRFDDARKVPLTKAQQKANDAITIDALYVSKLADEVAEEDPAARWAFAFAGGINVNTSSVKGMTFKSDFSFFVGDFGNGTEFVMNDIEMNLSSTAFKAYGRVKLVSEDDKQGFEGAVELETVKKKFAADFKFYQLYYITSGNKKGIEMGASILSKSSIPMGSITWTTIGGGFDLNTAQGTYKFFFKGSAINTGTKKELLEYRNINVSVSFDTKKCSGYPVIKGSMALFVNNSSFCNGQIELDLCELRVLGKIDCEKELISNIKAKMNAVITASKDGFLGGCSVSLKVLGFQRNATLALGVSFNTVSTSAKEVSSYVEGLPSYLKHSDNKTFSGFYFDYKENFSFKSSGGVSIEMFDLVAYSIEIQRDFGVHMGLNFTNANFVIQSYNSTGTTKPQVILGMKIPPFKYAKPTLYFKGRAEVLGFGLTGTLEANFNFSGGQTYGITFLTASASAKLEIFNGTGADFNCNRVNLKFSKHKVMVYPCGIKCSARWDFWNSCKVKWCDVDISLPNFKDGIGVKVCISGGFTIAYNDWGGWSFGLK